MRNNMTDQNTFIQDQGEQGSQSFQNTDQGSAGQGNQDTHDIGYQVQVMQKRLNDKDEFIKQLQTENQQTREMYASLEERMQNLSKIEEVLNNRFEQQDVSNQDTNLDEDALVGKVIETFKSKEAEQRMQNNYNTVLERMRNEIGEEHIESKVAEAAQSNGLSVDDMVNLAKKSPSAFYRMVGMEAPAQQSVGTPTPMRGTQTAPQETNQKDFAYYSKLMRENPAEYWKPQTQQEFRKLFNQQK